jgi:hypothetical protein
MVEEVYGGIYHQHPFYHTFWAESIARHGNTEV